MDLRNKNDSFGSFILSIKFLCLLLGCMPFRQIISFCWSFVYLKISFMDLDKWKKKPFLEPYSGKFSMFTQLQLEHLSTETQCWYQKKTERKMGVNPADLPIVSLPKCGCVWQSTEDNRQTPEKRTLPKEREVRYTEVVQVNLCC